MCKVAALILLTIASGLVSATEPSISTLSTEELFESVSPSVCTVFASDDHGEIIGQGSGFILRGSRKLVTNAHVLAGSQSATAKCGGQTTTVQRITGYQRGIDLVLAKIAPIDIEGLDLSPSHNLKPGTKVFAFGSPLGLEGTMAP